MISKKAQKIFSRWTSLGEHKRPQAATRNVATAYAVYSVNKPRIIYCRIGGTDYSDLNGYYMMQPFPKETGFIVNQPSQSLSALNAFFPPTFMAELNELGKKLISKPSGGEEQVSMKHAGRRYVLSAWKRLTKQHGWVIVFTSISIHHVKKTMMPSVWAVEEFERWFVAQRKMPSAPANKLYLKDIADGENPWWDAQDVLGRLLRKMYDDAVETDKKVVHHRHQNAMLTLMVLPGFVGIQRTALGGY